MKILVLLLFLLFILIWVIGFLFSHKIALGILVAVIILCRMKKVKNHKRLKCRNLEEKQVGGMFFFQITFILLFCTITSQ